MTPEQMAHVEWVLATILTDDDGAPIRALQQEKAVLEAEVEAWRGSAAGYGSDVVEWQIRAEQAERERDALAQEHIDAILKRDAKVEQAEATTRQSDEQLRVTVAGLAALAGTNASIRAENRRLRVALEELRERINDPDVERCLLYDIIDAALTGKAGAL